MKELSLHILDIAQNSIVAGASTIEIGLNENLQNDELVITISDNGKGIPESILCKVLDPYTTSRTTRKVGMGLPLLNDACKTTGGNLSIQSAEGKGTSVLARLGLNHFDRQPIGDIAGVIVILISSNPNIRFIYKHIKDGNEFVLDSQEVKEVLEGVPISSPKVGKMLKEMISLNLDEL
jgi:anti-sigma regulatory factor (Ser/Thr protein kinase)